MKWTICIKNTGFEASLEARKLYNVEDDLKAQALGMDSRCRRVGRRLSLPTRDVCTDCYSECA